MKDITVGIHVKVAKWFKVLLWVLPLLAKLRLIEAETSAKVVCKVSNYAIKYKVDKSKWKRLNMNLEYEML